MGALHPLDWIAIGGYLAVALTVGTVLARRASRSTRDFYLAGRSLPWWVAGTSLVATTFAADTPLVVTGWVRSQGIAGNWLWWGIAVGGALSFVVFAAWWRRLEVTTDAEVIERRYEGKPARVLRGFYGGYHAFITNTIVLSWVLLAAVKIARVVFDIEDGSADVWITGGALLLALSYSVLAGLWGVVVTDFFQFFLALGGALLLAWKAGAELGGLDGARAAFAELSESITRIVPAPGPGGWWEASFWAQGFTAFLVLVAVQGWSNKNADGGGYAVQRFSACRDENHARGAALWYHLAHYCLRPWPWIFVALASMVIIPEADLPIVGGRVDHEAAYPMMMKLLLGPGLFGILCASFLAAFMSTLDTHFNLASAYVVNDLYRRFLKPQQSERHYVWVGRGVEVLIGVLAAMLALAADSISDLFTFWLAMFGGLGPAILFRWFWWRANAWTEISALAASTMATLLCKVILPASAWPAAPFNGWQSGVTWDHAGQFLLIVIFSLAVSLTVTRLTTPVSREQLRRFYGQARPIGFWAPVREPGEDPGGVGVLLVGWLGGLALTFGLLAGIGRWMLGRDATLSFLAAAAGAALLWWSWPRVTALRDEAPGSTSGIDGLRSKGG